MHTFLSVGFAPTAALVTWQLQRSGAFQTHTYWPTHTIEFESEIFGNHVFQPNQLDLNTVSQPKPFDFVLLCVPALKDVERMVKKIERFVNKNTVVLVNCSEGSGLIQRLVRNYLPKIPVAGFVCDFAARHIPNTQTNTWRVVQWGNNKSAGPQLAIHIEPVQPKLLAPLESTLNACGLPTSRQKSPISFLALQWERNIFTVAFELVSIIFSCASIEKLVQDPMAKPIIEGVVAEILALAAYSGVKTLPPATKFIQQAPLMVRKAPGLFALPHASKLFYEFYYRTNIPLDLLVLMDIHLGEESKKLRTPYLESVYAFAVRLQQINTDPSDLFARTDLEAKQRSLDQGDAGATAALEAQLQRAISQCEAREAKIKDREDAFAQQQSDLEKQQAELGQQRQSMSNLEQRLQQLRAQEDQLSQREEALSERTRRIDMREREIERARAAKPISRAGSTQQLAQIARDDYMQSGRRGSSAADRPQMPQGGPGGPGGPGSPGGPGMTQGMPPGMPPGLPGMGPPGSRPVSRQSSNQQLNGNKFQHQQPPSTPKTPMVNGGPYMPSTPNGQGLRRPRQNQGPPLSNPLAQLKGRPSSRTSLNGDGGSGGNLNGNILPENLDMISLTQKPRRQSLKNGLRSSSMTSLSAAAKGNSGQTFSQNFQLDGIMGLASQDRYSLAHSTSRPRYSQAISADHLYASNRPFAHGQSVGGAGRTRSYAPPAASGVPPDFSNFGYSYESSKSHSQGSGSLSGSGNSRSTPPRSPSVTPPTPNTLEPTELKPFVQG